MAVWERAAFRPTGAPPRAQHGGLQGRRPLGRLPAFCELGGGEEGEGGGRAGAPRRPPLLPGNLPPVAAGGSLEGLGPGPPCGWLRGAARQSLLHGGSRGLTAGGSAPAVPCAVWVGAEGGEGEEGVGGSGGWRPLGGYPRRLACTPPPPLPATGRRAIVWAFANGRPAPCVAVASSRGTGGGGRGGGGAGAGGSVPGQRLVVNELRVSGTSVSRASACPWTPLSPQPGAALVPPPCKRRGGGGGCSGSGGLGLLGGCPGPLARSQPPVSVTWGLRPGLLGARPLPQGVAVTSASACLGAGAAAAVGYSGQWVRAVRRARGSQWLASASVMRSTAPPPQMPAMSAPGQATPPESRAGGPF